MRIVLKSAEKDFVLSHAFRILPLNAMDDETLVLRSKSYNSVSVKCNMFASMRPELQKFSDSYVIFMELKINFQIQTKAERYEISKAMFVCKLLVKVFTMH